MSTPDPPPDVGDLRGMARGLRELFEIAARTLAEDAGPSELGLRVGRHLGCELAGVVLVAERFPAWEHVNVQRGVDAYLRAQPGDPEWFGAPGGGRHPHEDLLSLITSPALMSGVRRAFGGRAASASRPGTMAAGRPATAPPPSGRRRTPRS